MSATKAVNERQFSGHTDGTEGGTQRHSRPAHEGSIPLLVLGGGVPSTAMALMAAEGLIQPVPKMALWADTGAELASVRVWIDRLTEMLPFPVLRASGGNLANAVLASRCGIPHYGSGKSGIRGCGHACRRTFRIAPLMREALRMVREAPGSVAELWLGIGADEGLRVKPAREWFATYRWPLLELGMSRDDCEAWLQARGHVVPRESGCVFCPYRSDRGWRAMLEQDAESFEFAAQFEAGYQASRVRSMMAPEPKRFVSRWRRPLEEVLERDMEEGQPGMWTNECEGVCGT